MAHTEVQLSDSSSGDEALTPCAALGDDGLWTVWQSYRDNAEKIRARFFDRREAGALETITPDGGLRHAPQIGVVGGVPTALWIGGDAEGHRVIRSSRTEAGWKTPEPLSDQDRVVSLHAAIGGDRLWATWCNRESPGTLDSSSSVAVLICSRTSKRRWPRMIASWRSGWAL